MTLDNTLDCEYLNNLDNIDDDTLMAIFLENKMKYKLFANLYIDRDFIESSEQYDIIKAEIHKRYEKYVTIVMSHIGYEINKALLNG